MKKIKFWIGGILIAVGVSVIGMFVVSYAQLNPESGRICEGVYIDTVNVGGMTESNATQAVSQYLQNMANRNIQVYVDDEIVETSLSSLGYQFKEDNYVTQALNIGKTGNILTRYKQMKDAQNEQLVLNTSFSLSDTKLKSFVKDRCSKYSSPAKNAGIKRVNQEFVYTEEQPGRTVNVDETIKKIKSTLQTNKQTQVITLSAVVVEDVPDVTTEEVKLCKDKLGTFSTSFNAGAYNRSRNLANAASLIDGKVIYPGETFSVYKTISPIEKSNGYYPAPSYENGEVVETYGGGVCQVSTTLYNAILKAELEIVERSPHSMIVSYVDPSMDAAIAGTYKDFKFKNNTDAPIYLAGYAGSGTITFSVYGHETRSEGRVVKYESETVEKMKPGADKVKKDPSKPKSYKAVTQEAHIGYKAKLWKIVTENGKETKTQVNSSTYSAVPRFIVVGTGEDAQKAKEKAAKEKAKEEAAKKKQQESQKKEGASTAQNTSAPTAAVTE